MKIKLMYCDVNDQENHARLNFFFTKPECNEGMQGSSNHELIQAIFTNEIVFAQGKKNISIKIPLKTTNKRLFFMISLCVDLPTIFKRQTHLKLVEF